MTTRSLIKRNIKTTYRVRTILIVGATSPFCKNSHSFCIINSLKMYFYKSYSKWRYADHMGRVAQALLCVCEKKKLNVLFMAHSEEKNNRNFLIYAHCSAAMDKNKIPPPSILHRSFTPFVLPLYCIDRVHNKIFILHDIRSSNYTENIKK